MATPIISPPGPLSKDGKSITAFAITNAQASVWTKTGGVFTATTTLSASWEAPNETGVFLVTAIHAPDPAANVTITVRAVMPSFWEWRTPILASKNVQIFRPSYGPSQSRGSGLNEETHDWELGNSDSSYENFLEVKAFWDYHYPGKLFDLIDVVIGERRTYEIDSNFAEAYNHQDSYSWGFRIKEAYPYASSPA